MNAAGNTKGTAVVTGASQGIGAEIARRLHQEGFAVALVARNAAKLDALAATIRKDGGRAESFPTDLGSDAEVMALPERIDSKLDPVQVLVNNAGLADSAPLSRSDDALWDRTMTLNVRAPFLLTRLFGRRMAQHGYGRVVNIASTASFKGYPYTAVYTASKHAILGATRAQAKEFANEGVTVNAVCPGFVRTPMTEATIANIQEKTGRGRDAALKILCADNPQGRLIEPEEVATAVTLFLAPQSDSITGQALGVSGGAVEG